MARKKKQKSSHVISVRLTCKEMDDLHHLMEHMQITKKSDLMRHMLGIVKNTLPCNLLEVV